MNQPNPFAANAGLLYGLANLPEAISLPPALSNDKRTRSAGTSGRNSPLIIASYFGHPSEAVVAQISESQSHAIKMGWLPVGDPLHVDAPSWFVAEVDRQLPHPIIDSGAEPRHDILAVPGLIFEVSAD